MKLYPDYDPKPGELRWYASADAAVRRTIDAMDIGIMAYRQAEAEANPSVLPRAEALQCLADALRAAQYYIDGVLRDDFLRAAEAEEDAS